MSNGLHDKQDSNTQVIEKTGLKVERKTGKKKGPNSRKDKQQKRNKSLLKT